jgi:leucyl-tRNA synthetase
VILGQSVVQSDYTLRIMTQTQAQSSDRQPKHRYNAQMAGELEIRWQNWWSEQGTYRQPNPGEPGFDGAKPKYYALDMFPYPSGAGLHVGHPEGYTATDIICRFKRMTGYNVLHPMGWDAFGLPAEQYAIQTGVHPEITTKKAIDNFRRQLQRFGFCYDWDREFGTIDKDYYKWTQWIFVKIYHSWFDPEADGGQGKARPINDLIEEFASGKRKVKLNPDAAEYTGAGDLPDGTDAGAWDTLDTETRKAVVDSYRLAYLSQQTVNWCPKLGTALANEEVIDGRSERGGFPVFRKPLRQWMFRITAFADRLLRGLEDLDWPSSTKTQQSEWIGRSEGAEVDFPIIIPGGVDLGEKLRIFTTRPDTIYGATYMVVAPEHPLVELAIETEPEGVDVDKLRNYVSWASNRSDVERQENKEKTGEPIGINVTNPVTGEEIPVWTADYVMMGYGTGAIMAVPGQDQRDWDFAKAFNLPIVRTVQPPADFEGEAYTGDGPAMNSGMLDGLEIVDAKAKMIDWLSEKQVGKRRINYKLRDWLFSRQRYWGEPFPIVFDERGHHHAVSVDTLPVELPPLADYEPVESDEPQPLLAKATDWVKTTAGEAGVHSLDRDAPVRRETNTMPGWAGSCWYYLRYCDNKNSDALIGEEADAYWLGEDGVDLYVGGAEHAVLHLLYARFWHMALHDLGYVRSNEPFRKLFHQGLITSMAYQRPDKSLVPIDQVENKGTDEKPSFVEIADGQPVDKIIAKMSKSLKNVVNPDDVIEDYGADTFRLYEMYMGPLEASKPWNTNDIVGLYRLLQKVWRLCVSEETGELVFADSADDAVEKQLHRTIAKVGDDIEKLSFNTAIAAIFEFVNVAKSLTQDQMDRFVRVIAPLTPHVAEELWHKLGKAKSVAMREWPSYDESMLVVDEIKGLIEGKTVRKIVVVPGRLVNIVAN